MWTSLPSPRPLKMNDTIWFALPPQKIVPSDRSGCRDYDPNHHSKEALTHFVSAPWCPKTTMFSFSGKNGGEKQNRSYLEITRAFGWNLEVNFQLPWWGVPHQTPRLTRIVAKPKALLSRHCKKVQSSPAPRFLPLSLSTPFLNQLMGTHWTSSRSTSEISQLNFPRENNASRVKMDQNGFSSEIVKYQLG